MRLPNSHQASQCPPSLSPSPARLVLPYLRRTLRCTLDVIWHVLPAAVVAGVMQSMAVAAVGAVGAVGAAVAAGAAGEACCRPRARVAAAAAAAVCYRLRVVGQGYSRRLGGRGRGRHVGVALPLPGGAALLRPTQGTKSLDGRRRTTNVSGTQRTNWTSICQCGQGESQYSCMSRVSCVVFVECRCFPQQHHPTSDRYRSGSSYTFTPPT